MSCCACRKAGSRQGPEGWGRLSCANLRPLASALTCKGHQVSPAQGGALVWCQARAHSWPCPGHEHLAPVQSGILCGSYTAARRSAAGLLCSSACPFHNARCTHPGFGHTSLTTVQTHCPSEYSALTLTLISFLSSPEKPQPDAGTPQPSLDRRTEWALSGHLLAALPSCVDVLLQALCPFATGALTWLSQVCSLITETKGWVSYQPEPRKSTVPS